MSSNSKTRPAAAILGNAGRRVGGRAMMFHQAIADHLGLNMSDLKCWDLAADEAPITAGRLAELTGLTTGALTGIVDRLERGGFVRREVDRRDRRRVLIHPVAGRQREVGRLFESMSRAMGELAARYTPEQVAVIADFMTRTEQIFYAETLKLRGEDNTRFTTERTDHTEKRRREKKNRSSNARPTTRPRGQRGITI
jgi:DNA-binding MarR family transcriptional regulator